MVRGLRATGVTIILTTHYIEEAEQMADRVGVINKGEIILVEDKAELMRKLGRKQLTLAAATAARRLPPALARARADACRRRPQAHLHLRYRRASAPASPRCSTICIVAGIALQGPAHDAKARSRTFSSAW